MRRVRLPSGRTGTVVRTWKEPRRGDRPMLDVACDDGERVNIAASLVKELEEVTFNGRPPKRWYPLGKPDSSGERVKILKALKGAEKYTAKKLANSLGWPIAYVRRRLMELRRERLVYLRWSGRTPFWSIRDGT